MDSALRVLICHKNQLLADCLSVVLSQQFSHECTVVEASNTAIPSIQSHSTDILLLDSRTHLSLALGLVQAARKANHQCRLLLLASMGLGRTFLDIASMQADGCVAEESPLDELRDAIETVRRGEAYCSPQIANELFSQMGRSDGSHAWTKHLDNVRLTPREREVLELIAWERLGNKQIARRLNISLYTVKNHVHNIIEKLGAEDRHEAADIATKRRILIGV